MAEAPEVQQKPLHKLEKEITCAVCHGYYLHQQARVLSCNHYYCTACIEQLAVECAQGETFQCPEYECRKKMILPTGGAAELPVAVCVEGMKRVYDMMARTEGWIEAKCVQCPVEKAVAFCRGCSEFICSGCVDTHERNRRSFFGHVVSNLRDMNEEQIMNISHGQKPCQSSALSMTRRLTCSVMIAIVSFVVTAPLLITETTTLPF